MKNALLFSLLLLMGMNLFSQQGCAYSGQITDQGVVFNSTGNSTIDQVTFDELNFLFLKFGVKPRFYFLQENGAPNAFATSNVSDPNYPDGTVYLGLNFIELICSKSGSGTCSAVPVVMSHEFGHILQFKYFPGMRGSKKKELFADFIAGFYLFCRIYEFKSMDVGEAARNTFEGGDTEFNSPFHHGTPEERLSALDAGYRLASGGYSTIDQLVGQAKLYVD
tara:strand:- start:533 stop:1198 length:666 start_codon:yes stop_codon:yes gene_type:complete